MRILPDWIEPEICPRIVDVAFEIHCGALTAERLESTVEVAFGRKGALENGNIGALTRRVPTGGVVRTVPLSRGKPKSPKEPGPPRVVELLRTSSGGLSSDPARSPTKADIARREGITRAREAQVMGMLRLASRDNILSMPNQGLC